MATTRFRKQAERDYYLQHTTGTSAQTPWDQLERTYYEQYINAHPGSLTGADLANFKITTSLATLRWVWARAWLTANGGAIPPVPHMTALWKAMVATLGRPVSDYVNDNKLTFFLNAA